MKKNTKKQSFDEILSLYTKVSSALKDEYPIRLSAFKMKLDLMSLSALRSSNACVVDESNKQQSSFRDDTIISYKTKFSK